MPPNPGWHFALKSLVLVGAELVVCDFMRFAPFVGGSVLAIGFGCLFGCDLAVDWCLTSLLLGAACERRLGLRLLRLALGCTSVACSRVAGCLGRPGSSDLGFGANGSLDRSASAAWCCD